MLVNTIFNNPFSVAREMDRLFDTMVSSQPFGFVPTIRAQWSFPPTNLWEDEECFYAEAELPGMTMEDIEVLATDELLTIKGSRNVRVPEEAKAIRRERSVGAFERTISLPACVDTDRIEARLTNGVLSITLPKAAECKPRRISVKALSDAS